MAHASANPTGQDQKPPQTGCSIRLLGELSAQVGIRTVTRFRTEKTAALLAYLAYRRGEHISREVLAELLWPDSPPAKARSNVSVALWSLRTTLEPPGTPAGAVLETDNQSLCLRGVVETDVGRFLQALVAARRSGHDEEKALYLRQAVEAYSGPLLPGRYEAWILPEAEALAGRYVEALEWLIERAERVGDREEAITFAGRLLSVDPFHEETHRTLIRLLAMSSNPGAAAEHCLQWEERLREGGAEDIADELREMVASLVDEDPGATRRHSSSGTSRFATRTADRGGSGSAQRVAAVAIANREAVLATPVVSGRATEIANPLAFMPPLPAYPSRLFGRDDELSRLRWLLGNPSVRLVTLTGPAGVGKTRVAVAAVEGLLPPPTRPPSSHSPRPDENREGSDGGIAAFYVLAEAIPDPETLPHAVLEVVLARMPEAGGPVPDEARANPLDWLAVTLNRLERPALLLLDGFEHLAEEGATFVEDLLHRTHRVTIVVTSRARLHAEGEHNIPVAPLPTPLSPLPSSPDEMVRKCAAIALFRDRAQMARSDFEVTPRNAAHVAGLVERLEGLPLALELAAARSLVLTPGQMLEQLDQSRLPLDFLANPGRGNRKLASASEGQRAKGGDRHRSLREAIGWSVRLLPSELQDFFAQLSVFEGWFGIREAEAVCQVPGNTNRGAVLDALTHLADSSLLRAELQISPLETDRGEEIQYRLLASLRAYASELLDGVEEESRLRRRHAEYYLLQTQNADRDRREGNEPYYLTWASHEYSNISAALRYLLEEGSSSQGDSNGSGASNILALQSVTALSTYWLRRGRLQEGWEYLKTALEKSVGLPEPKMLAAAHNAAGVLALAQGDRAVALLHHEAGLDACRSAQDALGTAAGLNNLANLHWENGDLVAAQERYRESLALWEAAGDRRRAGMVLNNLGGIAGLRSSHAEAKELLLASLAIARELGDARGEAARLRNLARNAYDQDDFVGSEERAREALEVGSRLEEPQVTAACLLDLGLARRARFGASDTVAPRLIAAAEQALKQYDISLPSWETAQIGRWEGLQQAIQDARAMGNCDMSEAVRLAQQDSEPGRATAGSVLTGGATPLPALR